MNIPSNTLFGSVAPMLASDTLNLGSPSITFGLFTNDFVPNPASNLGSFSIATNAGCATVGGDTAGASTYRDPLTGAWQVAMRPLNDGNWIASSSVGLPVTIYGGVVLVRGTNVIEFSNRFDTPKVLSVVGDGLQWEPKLTINPGLLS